MWDTIFSGSELTRYYHWWTAGYRSAGASRFVWAVTSSGRNAVTDMSYTNWWPGQPDRSGEACVTMHRGWRDYSCAATWFAVCEVDV